MTCNEDMQIIDFEEKPKQPKSTLASMGIYVFSWEKLKKYLIENENANTGSKDFGKDIIPSMLQNNERLFAYSFEGYWKDVGTLDSLWDANMDLINPNVPMDLHDMEWRIYSRNPSSPPQYIAPSAEVQNCMISDGSKIYGKVDFSVIYTNVTIEEGAVVTDSIVMPGAVIKKGARVEYAIIGENAVVGENSHLGARPEESDIEKWGICVIGPDAVVPQGKRVGAKEVLGKGDLR
jgi:glucose-1-phosphate adenylyltransferase